MKKFFTQILSAIGFVIILIGIIIKGNTDMLVTMFSAPFIAAAIALPFVFAKNATVKNTGYTLSALVGMYGIVLVLNVDNSVGTLISGIGMAVMLIPAALYAIVEFFTWCGFTRKNKVNSSNDLATILNQYKALESEKILSAEEFEELKAKTLKGTDAGISSVEDLKKWKKLLDQQIITEEEFSNLKAKVFNK